MKDRTLGYGILILLLIFLLSPSVYLFWKSFIPLSTRTIEFDSVNSMSFLSTQDPVRIRGVEIGTVKRVYSKDMKTYVQIITNVPLKIHERYNISLTAKGFMGEHFLSIDPGDSSAALINNNKILKGEFLVGLPELLPQFRKLLSAVKNINELTNRLKNGSNGSPGLVPQFTKISTHLDTLCDLIMTTSYELQNQFSKIDSISEFIEKTKSLTDNFSDSIPAILSNVNNLIRKADTLVIKVDSLLEKSDKLTIHFNDSESILVKDYISSLQKDLKLLSEIVKEFELDGIKLPIRNHRKPSRN